MKNRKIVIFGVGGHARVIADVFESSKVKVIGMFDDNKKLIGKKSGRWPVIGDLKEMLKRLKKIHNLGYFVAIGDNKGRETKTKEIISKVLRKPENCISAKAILSKNVKIDSGVFIAPGVVVNIGTRIKSGVIVNTAASIDHDCVLEEFSSIQPGVHLGGGVKVGKRSMLGIGASVKQYVTIGDDVIVGGGAMVIENITSEKRVFGVPAKDYKNL